MEIKEKYISEALLKDSPKKKLSLKIGEGVIKPEHLSKRIVDEVIAPLIEEKLVDSIRETVEEAIQHIVLDTYNKAEINQMISAIKQFDYRVVSTLPVASANTMNRIYLVPNNNGTDDNLMDEYITTENGNHYTWEKLGKAVDSGDSQGSGEYYPE